MWLLSMLGIKLIHVSKWAPAVFMLHLTEYHTVSSWIVLVSENYAARGCLLFCSNYLRFELSLTSILTEWGPLNVSINCFVISLCNDVVSVPTLPLPKPTPHKTYVVLPKPMQTCQLEQQEHTSMKFELKISFIIQENTYENVWKMSVILFQVSVCYIIVTSA